MPAYSFLGRLRLAHKFIFLCVIALLLASIPTFFYVREAAKGGEGHAQSRRR